MSTKISQKQYSARITALNKLGLAKGVSRKPTSDKERFAVNRLWSKYKDIGSNPSEFAKVTVGKLNTKDKNALKKTGYRIIGDKAYIPKNGQQSVSLRKHWTKDEDGNPVHDLELVRRTSIGGKKQEFTEYIGTNTQKLKWYEKLIKQYEELKLRPGEVIMLTVYGNSPMGSSRRVDVYSIIKYAEEIEWDNIGEPGSARYNSTRSRLLNSLHLVKVYTEGGNQAPFEKSTKQLDKEKRVRAKRRSITGTKSKPKSKGVNKKRGK